MYYTTPAIGHQIEQFQQQAAIICSEAYLHAKYETLLNEIGWESLSSRRRQHKLVLFYKILNKIYPSYLYSFIKFKHIGQYNLRRTQEIVPRFTRLSLTFRSYFPSTTRDWNKLSNSTKNSLSVVTFKSLIRDTNLNPFHKLCTGRKGIWLSRLRMELSPLNHHRFRYNFIPYATCPMCNTSAETTVHFFFYCSAYRLARITLLRSLENDIGLDTHNHTKTLETILFGKHISPNNYNQLLNITYNYLTQTNRFM